MSIKVSNVSKQFGRFEVLEGVSLDVQEGEFVALLGPSGSGKTTLLRIIAGLEIADSGEVLLKGENTAEKTPRERKIGFVFQHYSLFRHMTVFENVAFGLRVRHRKDSFNEEEIYKRVVELLRLVQLKGLEYRYPSQLSGGQRQRVALARVLAVEPQVMLLDEPFGSLDAKVRKELRRWLRRLHEEMQMTTVLVTHDQEEAMEIADRVAVMNEGKIVQMGTPGEIWDHPMNSFVYDFLGNYNEFLAWKDENGKIHLCDDAMLPKAKRMLEEKKKKGFIGRLFHRTTHFFSRFSMEVSQEKKEEETSLPVESDRKYLKLFVRPFEMVLDRFQVLGEESVPVCVVHVNPAGSLIKVELERKNGQLIQAEISKEKMEELKISKGETLWVYPKDFKIFEEE